MIATAWLAAAAVAGGAAGCATQAPVRLYSLQSPEPALPARDALRPVWVQMGSVGLPVDVDQPEWLVRASDGSLRLLEQTRWAAPLHNEVRSALMDALQTRWAASPANQGVPDKAAVWRVVVDVQRFESLPGVEARLAARWSISPAGSGAGGKAPWATCRGRWTAPAPGDVAALANAHRADLSQLADAIGEGLQAAASGAPSRCMFPSGGASADD